jgi:hypothetical protein
MSWRCKNCVRKLGLADRGQALVVVVVDVEPDFVVVSVICDGEVSPNVEICLAR